MHLLNLIPFIKHFHSFAYWLAFFVAILETFVGIGFIIPGSSIIVVLGGLASEGYFDIGDLISFVIVGAITGDTINYFIGRKFRNKLLSTNNFFIKPSLIEKSINFFKKYGGKSVFIGRFIPSLRETVPLIAGLSQMSRKKFFIWNFMGAFFWGITLSLSGYYFNSYFKISKLVLTRSGIVILGILGVFILFNSLKNMVIKNGIKISTVLKSIYNSLKVAFLENAYIKMHCEKHKNIYSFLHKRMDKKSFSGLPLTFLSFSFLYLMALFGGVVEDLIKSETIVFADVRIDNLLRFFRHENFSTFFLWITLLGKMETVLIFSLLFIIFLLLRNQKNYITPFIISLMGSSGFSYLGKLAFHRARPLVAFYAEKSYSFPSGHSSISIALYGFIAYIFIKNSKKWKTKVNILFTSFIIILLIGFSRLYLGVHYFSDVLGGYLVGTIWLVIAIGYSEYKLFYKKESPTFLPNPYLNYLTIFIFLISYTILGLNYNPVKSTPIENTFITVSNPLEIFKNENQKFSETILGSKQEPISFIIVAKDDASLIQLLEKSGWFLAEDISALNILNVAKSLMLNSPYPQAPIFPNFWNSDVNTLGFEKPVETNKIKERHLSRFWKTNYISTDGQHIYVGIVSLDERTKWFITHKINPNIDGERELLFNDIIGSNRILNYKKIEFIPPEIGKTFLGNLFFTDGKVFILYQK